jgi:hypothetical protein
MKYNLRDRSECFEYIEKLEEKIEPLRYFQGIEECECASHAPIGGCLKCALDELMEELNEDIDNT